MGEVQSAIGPTALSGQRGGVRETNYSFTPCNSNLGVR